MKKMFSFLLCMVMLVSFVTTANAIKSVPVKGIKLDKSAITLEISKTYTLKLQFTPANTTQKLVKYSTSNKNVAMVDAKGKITAVNAGKAVITVTSTSSKKVSAKCNITVPEKIDPLGKYKTPITLTSCLYLDPNVKFKEGEDINNNIWTRTIKDKLGIQIKYSWIASTMDIWQQKMNVSIATNEIPDFFKIKDEQFITAIESGELLDLTNIYKKYVTDLLNNKLTQSDKVLKMSTYKGKLYGLPKALSPYGSSALIWVREDWMKNLGLQQPKTIDDVINMARAFTNKDPDKDNKNDTFGLAVNKNIFKGAVGSLKGFFESYHAYVQDMWILKDGKLEFGGIQPETKKALTALVSLYKAGCIDTEFGVKAQDLVAQDFAKGKLGLTYGVHYVALSPLNDTKKNYPESDFTPYALVSSDSETAVTSGSISCEWHNVVNKKCKYPEAMIKIANLIMKKKNDSYKVYWDDGSEIKAYGCCPVSVDGGEDETSTQSERLIYAMKNNDTSKLLASDTAVYESGKKWVNDNKNATVADWSNYRTFFAGSSWELIDKEYIGKGRMKLSEFYGAPTSGMAEYKATLEKLQIEAYMKIITGHEDISYFDKFTDEWMKLGGDRISQEVNVWYKNK